MPILGSRNLTRTKIQPVRYPERARTVAGRLPGGVNYPAGTVMAEQQIAARNETQTVTITGTPTGGSITLSINGSTTVAIAFDATAATVQAALETILGVGNVTVSGGPGPGTAWVAIFAGEYGNSDVALMTAASSLTGGTTPAVAVTESQKGSPGLIDMFAAYNDAGSNGLAKAMGVLMYSVQTDAGGRILDEFGISTELTTPIYVGGEFLCSELTGLDANGVADLGKLSSGSAYTVAGAILSIT